MIRARLALGADDLVVELASNDGYLLQHFVGTRSSDSRDRSGGERRARRPRSAACRRWSRSSARDRAAARRRGQARRARRRQQRARPGSRSQRLRRRGARSLLRPTVRRRSSSRTSCGCSTGCSTTRSTTSTSRTSRSRRSREIFAHHGLEVYDVEELWTHGGSLRVYAQHAAARTRSGRRSSELLAREDASGLRSLERYARFADEVKESKRALLDLLIGLRRDGQAGRRLRRPGQREHAAQLLRDSHRPLDYTVDRNPYKHGLFTPGTHIPIHPPERIAETRAGLRRRAARGTSSTRSRRSSSTSPSGAAG